MPADSVGLAYQYAVFFTKWLRYDAPFLLFLFFVANFTPWHPRFRNFLFMGLPCMMVGRSIRENKD